MAYGLPSFGSTTDNLTQPSGGFSFGGLLGTAFEAGADYLTELGKSKLRREEVKTNDRELQTVANGPVSNKTLFLVGGIGAALLVVIIVILRK